MSIYAVLGAGNGGQTLAAVLKNLGHEVRLWNRSPDPIKAIDKQGGIELRGAITIKACPDLLSNDIFKVINRARIIFIVVPAHVHYSLAKIIAPIVQPSQVVVLNPGRTAGALEFRETLKKYGCAEPPAIIETESLLYTCRSKTYGSVEVLAVKRENHMASLPGVIEVKIKEELSQVYAGLKFSTSTLCTGLENMGAIFHPAPVLLNTGWIESRDTFFPHYYYGISKSIAAFLEKMDKERLAVAKAYGISVRSAKKWHEDVYGCVGNTLFETLNLNIEYASIDAPYSLNHRYLLEDVPTGLVPISELGRVAGVSIFNIDMIIELANAILKTDFRKRGRNLKRLGLEGKSVDEIIQIFSGK